MAANGLREKPGLVPKAGWDSIGSMRAVFVVLMLVTALVRAHQIEEIGVKLETDATGWQATLEIDAAYMLPEYRGDADIAPFDLAWLRTRSPEEWQRIRSETEAFLAESLRIGGGDPSIRFPDFESDPPAFTTRGIPEALPEIEVELTGVLTGDSLEISWRERFDVILILEYRNEVLPLVSGESVNLEVDGGIPRSFPRWVGLGFRHILPDGLDHILFVLGIFLLQPRWKPLLYQSLTFTLAHSLTLAAAALGWLALPERWVETAIAVSIAWIAAENLWVKEPGRWRYAMIAGFGLVHGLGFARMLAVALPDEGPLLMPLVGFNLGVEFGQLVVIAAAWGLAGWWKPPYFARLRIVASVLIMATGLMWAVTRISG